MNIKLVDLRRLDNKLRSSIDGSVREIINSGDFILGRELQSFEKEFASYIGTKYCVGVASGTDAILLSLIALGVTRGDEVIVPAMTFIASVAPILTIGAKPVFVDIFSTTPCINSEEIEQAITGKTKAILPVHLHGYPSDMKTIKKIARKHKLFVIEDACQSHGSTYRGKKAGSFGDIAAFSFYPGKNLGAYGDGGAITTNKKALYKKLLLLRNHGQRKKYKHVIVGFNSRLDTVQAAVLRKKLKYLDNWNKKRRSIANAYAELLSDLPLTLPVEERGIKTNFHLYVVRTKLRDSLLIYLQKNGIECGIHYPTPIHLLPIFKNFGQAKQYFKNAELLAKTGLSLPMFPELTKQEVFYICNHIRKFFTNFLEEPVIFPGTPATIE